MIEPSTTLTHTPLHPEQSPKKLRITLHQALIGPYSGVRLACLGLCVTHNIGSHVAERNCIPECKFLNSVRLQSSIPTYTYIHIYTHMRSYIHLIHRGDPHPSGLQEMLTGSNYKRFMMLRAAHLRHRLPYSRCVFCQPCSYSKRYSTTTIWKSKDNYE